MNAQPLNHATSETTTDEGPLANKSVLRALDILTFVAKSENPVTLSDVARSLEIPRSSALSILSALTKREFLRRQGTSSYSVGLSTFELGSKYIQRMTPVHAVEPELGALTDALVVTSHFAVVDGCDVVYLSKRDAAGPGIRLASSIGARLPASSTAVGKAQLAFRGKSLQNDDEIPDATESLPELELEFESVRERGYAIDEGATAPGVRCVAAPVFDAAGACCGAIGVSYLIESGPSVESAGHAVSAAARRASTRLGAPPISSQGRPKILGSR